MSGQKRPARRFGRVSGQHQPQRHGLRPAIAEAVERIAERVAWNSSLELVLPPAPKPVVLLCDVDELEVEREGADHGLLLGQPETANGLPESISRGTFTRLPCKQANAFFGIQQLRPVLLDHHPPEHVAEQPDVPSEPGVGDVGAHPHILPRKRKGAEAQRPRPLDQPAGSGVGSATIAAAGAARACPCERPRCPCASVP